MLDDKTIGFIGAGNMGQALLGGLIDNHVCDPSRIICSDLRQDQLEQLKARFGIGISQDNRQVIQAADIVILAIKPQILPQVVQQVSSCLDNTKLIISIAAGVSTTAIEALMPENTRLVRAMPNVCATVKQAMTALVAGACATGGDIRLAEAVFNAVGRTVVLKEEALMDAVTGLSASGPAYVFLIMEALADGGVAMGLARPDALMLAAQTLLGAAKLQIESSQHPGQLKDLVTSPGGTTIAGLHALEKAGVRGALMDAVAAATQRSITLGQLAQQKSTGPRNP